MTPKLDEMPIPRHVESEGGAQGIVANIYHPRPLTSKDLIGLSLHAMRSARASQLTTSPIAPLETGRDTKWSLIRKAMDLVAVPGGAGAILVRHAP